MKEELKLRIAKEDEIEFVGQLIDIFDDFLEERGIVLNDEDSEEDTAIIHGDDYFELEGKILDTLNNWSGSD